MATEKQIAANRENAKRSSGPSEASRSKTRFNATRHGLASELPELETNLSPEFLDRRAKWGAEQRPHGVAAGWALDRAVAATFRIERCEQGIDAHIAEVQNRARLSWDEDRALEAATLFDRLERNPILVSRQLQTTLAGVVLLIEAWMLLGEALEGDRDWSESERSRALDLLGVDPDFRSGRTVVDAPEGEDSAAFRRALALEEFDRLETLRDHSMIPLDEMARRRSIQGDVALLSKEAKLLLRYEREAWTHFKRSMKQVQNPTPVVVAPTPLVIPPPRPLQRPIPPIQPTLPEPRPAEPAKSAPARNEANFLPIVTVLGVEDPKLGEFDGRRGILNSGSPFAPERSQFLDFAIGRAS